MLRVLEGNDSHTRVNAQFARTDLFCDPTDPRTKARVERKPADGLVSRQKGPDVCFAGAVPITEGAQCNLENQPVVSVYETLEGPPITRLGASDERSLLPRSVHTADSPEDFPTTRCI